MVAIKSLVASTLLALLLAPAAALAEPADSPALKPDAGDQAWAQQALLKPGDFGVGWQGGIVKSSKPAGPACPGFDPKESDLVVTGHANASFGNKRAGVQVSLDSQVLETVEGVHTDFARTIQPPLAGCLAYQLKQDPSITGVAVEPLDFPKVGTRQRRLPRHDHGADQDRHGEGGERLRLLRQRPPGVLAQRRRTCPLSPSARVVRGGHGADARPARSAARMRRLLLVALGALVLAGTALADPLDPKVAYTKADQANAKAAVLVPSVLGPAGPAASRTRRARSRRRSARHCAPTTRRWS